MNDIYIKNMVCNRCIMVVQSEVEKLGLALSSIQLGKLSFVQALSTEQRALLSNALVPLGFELIDDKKSLMIERIKKRIIELVHQQEGGMKLNLSELLSEELNHHYHYLSNLFSESEGVTIEKYFIAQKIEKAKELLMYDELSLTEIADRLNYSNVAYLSNQFKKLTGYTPSHFKQMSPQKRKPLDRV